MAKRRRKTPTVQIVDGVWYALGSYDRQISCRRCVWGCPWNGQGWGCSHPGYDRLVTEDTPPCGGAEFRQLRPWHRIGYPPRDPA